MSGTLFSLNEYITAPDKQRFRINLESEHFELLKRFIPRYQNPIFLQWKNIKNTKAALVRDGVLSDFPLHIIPTLKPKTYMIDGGGMYFSLGALILRSSLVTLSVFCHELAHTWLSGQDFYPELKQINKEFISLYSHKKGVSLMSPIEFYAMAISIDVLERLSAFVKNKSEEKRLAECISNEREKLEFLKKEISSL